MSEQENILQNFDSVLMSIKKMEESTAIFNELSKISKELQDLRNFIHHGLRNLNFNFDTFSHSIDTFSDLIEIQKQINASKNADRTLDILFQFLRNHVGFDDAFIIYKLREEDETYELIPAVKGKTSQYQNFISKASLKTLPSLFQNNELSHLIVNTTDFTEFEIPWELLNTKSAIIFSLKIRGHLFGMGFLLRRRDAFETRELSVVNVVNNLIALLVYHNYYYAWVKSRMIQQAKQLKLLDEVKYSSFFESGPVYIFTLDSRSVILHANTTALDNLENGGHSIIGENFFDLIPHVDRSTFKKFISEHRQKKFQIFRSSLRTRNGRTPVMEFIMNPVKLGKQLDLLVIMAGEVTESHYREQLLRRNEVLDEIDQFSRILVAQFNNLLTTIQPAIQVMKSAPQTNDSQKIQLQTIEEAANRSANLIQKFLDYDVETEETQENININKLLNSYISAVRKNIPDNIKIQVETDSSVRNTAVYPLKIRRVLDILVSNSVIALQDRENPMLTFSTALVTQPVDGLVKEKPFYLKKGEYIELSVRDNGSGIPEKSVNEVLKPFYSTRIKNEGVGLELFIAYNLIKDMKGNIFLDSEVDKYTSVYVYLPFKEEKMMESRPVEAEKKPQPARVQKPTVLVVDDEYNIRSMMKEIMEMSGFRVLTAGNGRDGIEIYQRHEGEIDLIIMDIIMPVMDGRAAFNEIRKLNPQQKIFIISGYSQREDLEDILGNGAVGFLRKPFQVKEIVDRVKEILELE
ncbi:MAG: response regulator [Calditrichaeota bacterium]|nr:response regulator [Calditrichota bacterium]RQV98781.1 MAG: response regulator [Calditrichota bacterium]